MTTMDVKKYLARIGYQGSLDPTHAVLANLQSAHLLNVPFENLDIHNKIKIDLANSYQKIVTNNRGGFCYELNSTFFGLLQNLGFAVKLVSARVFSTQGGYGEEFDHMAIVATIDGNDYLVDVGFGEFTLRPLAIEMNRDQFDPRGVFSIGQADENSLVVTKRNENNEYEPQYKFTLQERKVSDFLLMCEYHQTSPLSHFTQKRICSLPTPDGRISLSGNVLKITSHKTVSEIVLPDEQEVSRVLQQYFKIIVQ